MIKKESKNMSMSSELLEIAKMDLQASKVLYENRLYSQAIFYFQQSVEKANKAFALITNQVDEKELPKKIGHEPIKIYEKNIKQQKDKHEQLNQNLKNFPELKEISTFKNLNNRREFRQFDLYLSYLKEIKQEKNELIFMSSWDIRRFLKEIKLTKINLQKDMLNISKFKITKRDWMKAEKNFLELYNFALKYNPVYAEEMKDDFKQIDIKKIEEILKNLSVQIHTTSSILISLYHLAIITLPHSTITRYPLNGLSPIKIYNKKLSIVKKLPELIEVHDNTLDELKIFAKETKEINAEGH